MFDIHQRLFDDNGDIDDDRIGDYIDGLMREFESSAEARAVFDRCGDSGWSAIMMEFAIDYIGSTPPDMSRRDFDEILFKLFPRKVSTPAESAPSIVAELRAFWTFLHRQYGLTNAPQILVSLTDAAVKRLEKVLANPANFGMAKSIFMLGMESGFDMTTQEGNDAFMVAYNSRLVDGGRAKIEDFPSEVSFVELPPLPSSPKQRADKRKKRKAQRQAKKRNRR
jgi:hypothetical protein